MVRTHSPSPDAHQREPRWRLDTTDVKRELASYLIGDHDGSSSAAVLLVKFTTPVPSAFMM